MIISRARSYIFVHAPKTGGTALTLALEDRAAKDDIIIGDTPKAKRRQHRLNDLSSRGRLWKHSTLADIEGIVSAQELDAFFIFTLVRNPWDRVVSYYHWLKERSFEHPAVEKAKSLSFHEFVLDSSIARSFQKSPSAFYVTDAAGTERKAHFVRLENLGEDLKPVNAHLGFNLPPITKVNTSNRDADFRPYYTDETRQAVAEFCAEDIARFRYTYD